MTLSTTDNHRTFLTKPLLGISVLFLLRCHEPPTPSPEELEKAENAYHERMESIELDWTTNGKQYWTKIQNSCTQCHDKFEDK